MPDEDTDFSKLKVAELKAELKKRGLNTEGKKNELVERLQLHIGDSALLDDTHDDLLDEDVLSEDDVLNDPSIDTPPEPSGTAQKRPSDNLEDEEVKRNAKKIILNRNVVADPPPAIETDVITPTESEIPALNIEQPGATIKLSGLTQKERLERRAARFGSAPTVEAAKVIATPQIQATTSKSIITAKSPSDLELLKKRAERFGTVAPILEKVELEERRKKRMERFGAGMPQTKPGTVELTASNGSSDKKAVRAQRFQSS